MKLWIRAASFPIREDGWKGETFKQLFVDRRR